MQNLLGTKDDLIQLYLFSVLELSAKDFNGLGVRSYDERKHDGAIQHLRNGKVSQEGPFLMSKTCTSSVGQETMAIRLISLDIR